MVVFTGCREEDPFDKLTSIDAVNESMGENNPSGILPDLSVTENLGDNQVGKNILLNEITPDSGIDFTYRTVERPAITASWNRLVEVLPFWTMT